MTETVKHSLRSTRSILAMFGVACLLQGCLSYSESGELNSNGSGKLSIAFGVSDDNINTEKVSEVRYAVKRLVGIRWLADIDSTSPGRHWLGARLEFDSLSALRPLNSILPMENLFGNMKLANTDSGVVLRRSLKLPSGTSADGDAMKIRWKMPRRILSTDRHAKLDSDSNIATWNLPTDGRSGEWTRLEVRWEKSILPDLPLMGFSWPHSRMEWTQLTLAVSILLLSVIVALAAKGRLRDLRRID